jgi:RNA polymerase sigma-70 factor (ECF subfamily)
MTTASDQITALKAGDPDAWRSTLAVHGPRLLGYASRMLGDTSAGEEVVQDALVAAYRSVDRFDGRASIKSWLFRIVHNRAIDEIRRRKRYVDVGDDPEAAYFNASGRWDEPCAGWQGSIEDQIGAKRALERVRLAIEALPHAHREVLLLKEVEGLETAEVCETLGIQPGNLRIRLHRARGALRAVLVEEMKEV